jgi:chromate reductase, NAD(P)H dehydrogenase (quinone)
MGTIHCSLRQMRVVAICGSLRLHSTNVNALKALALAAPEHQFDSYDISVLPHFNPDLDVEGATPPSVVADLRDRIRAADAVVISTPEYAHGLPGSLKNMLDWLVSDGTLVGKRVVVINATPPAQFAQASLLEILKTMNWNVVATVELPLRGKKLTAEQIAADEAMSQLIASALRQLEGPPHRQ